MSAVSTSSSLSQFDLKQHGTIPDYDAVLKEYVIDAGFPLSQGWDASLRRKLYDNCNPYHSTTPATSINLHTFENSPFPAPMDPLFFALPIVLPTNTYDPESSIFDHHGYSQDYSQSTLHHERFLATWEGYRLVLEELQSHQERISRLRRRFFLSDGDSMDIAETHRMEWLFYRYNQACSSICSDGDVEAFLAFSFRSSPLMTLLITKTDVLFKRKQIRLKRNAVKFGKKIKSLFRRCLGHQI